jgi:hypothetical protein
VQYFSFWLIFGVLVIFGETNLAIMTEKIVGIPDEVVLSKIYMIRDQKVMLDFDLARLYNVENRALKQAVKRNLRRFPEDFMFQLTKTEWGEVITICDNLPETAKFSPATPFAFTEYGVVMLSSVLNSERAIHVNIEIIRIFTKIRKILLEHKDVLIRIEQFENR